MQVMSFTPDEAARLHAVRLNEVETTVFKDIGGCDVGIVWNQVLQCPLPRVDMPVDVHLLIDNNHRRFAGFHSVL
jgi:hypothetical protein